LEGLLSVSSEDLEAARTERQEEIQRRIDLDSQLTHEKREWEQKFREESVKAEDLARALQMKKEHE
jgi:hypothetical protein